MTSRLAPTLLLVLWPTDQQTFSTEQLFLRVLLRLGELSFARCTLFSVSLFAFACLLPVTNIALIASLSDCAFHTIRRFKILLTRIAARNYYRRRLHDEFSLDRVLGSDTVSHGVITRFIIPDLIHRCSSYVSILLFVFTMINLGVLFWKRHSHPANLIFLSTFTLLEAFAVGLIVTFYDQFIVLQALFVILSG